MFPLGLFTTQEALDAGWTIAALRHAVRIGLLRRIRRGVYARVDVHDDLFERDSSRLLTAAIAATRTSAAADVSHRSAAVDHHLPVLTTVRPCVTLPPGRANRHSQLHVHRAGMDPAHLLQRPGYRVTTPARTIVDLGREHGRKEAVVAGDAAIRRGILTKVDVDAVLADCRGWPGVRAARAAVGLLDGRSESPLESLSRLALITHGFDVLVQPVISDEEGQFIARADFYIEELGVVGEADGLGKYEINGVYRHGERRRQLIENMNFGFVRWQWADLASFEVVAERIRHAGRYRHGPVQGIVRPTPPIAW